MDSGYQRDAEAAGRTVAEILTGRRPRIWDHLGDDEGAFVAWLARWAFHWGRRALPQEGEAPTPTPGPDRPS